MDALSQAQRSGDREPIEVELSPMGVPGYAAIVSLCGEHDLATSAAIRIALLPIYGNVLVDLSACEFIDSTVIGSLLEKAEDLRREGHRLELVVPSENTRVRRIIDVIGLHTILAVYQRTPGGH